MTIIEDVSLFDSVCPNPSCESDQVKDDGQREFDSDEASVKVRCEDCGTVWFEIYTADRIEIIEKGHNYGPEQE